MKNFFSATIILGFISLSCIAIGIFKEGTVAYYYGIHNNIDVFYLSLSTPLFISSLLGSALSVSVVPAYIKAERHNKGKDFLGESFWFILFFLIVLTLLCVLYIILLQDNFIKIPLSKKSLLINVGLILSPIIILQGISCFFDGIFIAKNFIFSNSLLNILIPLGTIFSLFIIPSKDIFNLCFGLYLGYILKITIQIYFLKNNLVFNQLNSLKFSKHAEFIKDTGWLILSSAILGLLPLISMNYASYAGEGSVATLNYANKILGSGLAVIVIIINSLIFPYLSQKVIISKNKAIEHGIKISFIFIVFLALILLPISLFSELIIKIFFERGQFSNQTTAHVTQTLNSLFLYVPFYIGSIILGRVAIALSISRIFIFGNLISLFIFSITGWYFLVHYNIGLIGISYSLFFVYSFSFIYLLVNLIIKKRKLERPQNTKQSKY